jgi:16S rRNA (cytosine967-C5)-methyltransferase
MASEARRLGLANVTRVVADAAQPIKFPERFSALAFDRVLVDAPCTGLGTIRRKPEIRWKRKPEDIPALAELQRRILENVSSLVKPGGALVYSTCTFTSEENEAVISPLIVSGRFLQEDPARDLPALAPLVQHKMLRAWPHLAGTDGFTIFRLRRK